MNKLSLYVIFLGGAALVAAATVGLWQEHQYAPPFPSTTVSRLLAAQDIPGVPKVIPTGRSTLLGDCLDLFETPDFEYSVMNPDQQVHIDSICEKLALDAVARAPTYSFGWLMVAMTAARKGEVEQFNRGLRASQATGPFEQWIGERRVALTGDHFEWLDEETRASELLDLRMLVASNRGIRSIAARYVSNAAFRNRITDVVEQMPDADQRRFLSVVRSASAASVN